MIKRKRISSTMLNFFLIVILLGAVLLKLPVSTKNEINFIDALFESTSSVSTTGLSIVNLNEKFTFFGQFIILCLVEIGTIGFLVLFSIFFMIHKNKIRLSNTLILSNETNISNYSIIKKETLRIIYYTLIIEFFGSWLLAFRFIPIYGVQKGLWYSIFHSVSAFCNAGFDLIGNNSFIPFRYDIYFNIVMILLMFLGSIGYFVLRDLWSYFLSGNKNKIQIQSRLILKTTFSIIFIGTILIKIFNPKLSILDSMFSVITSRSTGFYTIDFSELSEMSKIIITVIMFIGGSPASNSGGIRVVVFAILFLTVISELKNNDEVIISYRNVDSKIIKKAITIFIVDSLIIIFGVGLLYLSDNTSIIDLTFYVVSAFSTTGLSTIDVMQLSFLGKCVSIFIMYLGRIAPITFLTLFIPTNTTQNSIKHPNIDIIL